MPVVGLLCTVCMKEEWVMPAPSFERVEALCIHWVSCLWVKWTKPVRTNTAQHDHQRGDYFSEMYTTFTVSLGISWCFFGLMLHHRGIHRFAPFHLFHDWLSSDLWRPEFFSRTYVKMGTGALSNDSEILCVCATLVFFHGCLNRMKLHWLEWNKSFAESVCA